MRVKRFVTICASHYGTWVAYFHQGLGCVQMRPDSAFLQDLNRNTAMLKQLSFASIITPYDMMSILAKSSQLPVGREVGVSVLTHD
ncbi:MAG: hypothetical protein HXY43_04775 [Fischerella sp.]|jgi:triacylglycerol lipase|uniref:hypothetical protein n=1 Tax=Fischerella sp. TaxID=1191 RepID=UPI0017A45A0F|nr:hypothetical protein [Fischerella sp.]